MPLPLPTLSVQIAFNPTNLQSLTQTWTDVTSHVRDFTTNSGRQHFLDRIESSTIRLTLDNRTGFFLNGTTNGSGSVIRTRLPIKVTATTGGTTYPVFWGLTETAEERTADQLNQDILLTATDNTKFLSLLYMNRPTFWSQYAKSANAISWYRCDSTQAMPDLIGNNTGQVTGSVQNVAGALLYDTDTAIDMTNGDSSGTNFSYLSFPTGATDIYSIDFWVIGNQLAGQYLTDTTTGASPLYVTQSGALQSLNTFSGATNPYFQNKAANVADGQWHHVGLVGYKSGSTYPLYLYLDGTYVAMGDNGIPLCASATFKQMRLGNLNGIYSGPSYAYYDEVVMSEDTGSLATIQGEINNRFKAGSLLNQVISSGDRIAEVLTLAGYGSISGGALVVPNYTVNDVAWNQSAAITSISGTGTTATATLASNPWTAGQSVFISGNTYSGSIANISWFAGIATVTMTAAHAYTVGTNVTITGSSIAAYNGTWAVQSVGLTTWTFLLTYSSSPGTGTGGTTSGPSYYNGLFTVTTATSTTFAFSSTGTATITGGTASVNSTSTFSVQGLQSPVTGSTALDLIQQVTDTDVGAFFQNTDGTFEFDTQAYLYTATKNTKPSGADIWSDTDPMDGSVTTFYEPSTLQVLRDDADVWTTVKITAQNGTVQTYENTAAEPLYAYSTLTKSNVVSVTNEQALQEAIYLGNLYQSPLPRVQNVELSSKMNNGANLAEMLKPYLNDQVLFQRTPNGASTAGSINSTMVIESIRHDFQADPGYWQTSFTLDPFPKRGRNLSTPTFFMLFDDSTYGKFDTTNQYL